MISNNYLMVIVIAPFKFYLEYIIASYNLIVKSKLEFFKIILRRALAWAMRPASPAGLGGWAAAAPGGGFDPRKAGAGEVFYFSKNKKNLKGKIKLDKFQL